MSNRSRKIRIFESAIERVARVLSKKWKIRVVFQPGRCETSGSTIYLPTLPDNASKDLTDAMQGYLDHESAHVVHTDFSSLKRVTKSPKTMTVLNAMEDPRIEVLWCKMYPGAKLNLRRSHEWALKKVSEEKEMVDPEDGQTKKMRPWDSLSNLGKFLHASITYTNNEFDDKYWFLRDVVEDDIMKDVKKYSSYFRKALEVKNTNDLIPLAKELLKKLGEEDPETEEQEKGQGGEESETQSMPGGSSPLPQAGRQQSPQESVMNKQPKNSQQSGSTAASPQTKPGISADDEEDTEKEEAEQNQSSSGGADTNSKYDTSDEEVEQDEKIRDVGDKLKDAAHQEVSEEDSYLVYSTEGDVVERIKDGDRIKYKRFMQEAVKYVAPMKRKMSRSMLATKQSRWEGDKTRGKINPRRVYQVATGASKRVFRQRVHSEDFDTCVLLMVDHSGSMAGSRLDLAAKTSIVFGELLSQLSIPFSVQGFSTGSAHIGTNRKGKASNIEQSTYKRWGDLWIGEYKNFDDSWSSSGPKMINMVKNNRMNTYDGESLRYGAQTLLARPEKRKILFWLNDGYPCPNYADDSTAHQQYAKDCAKEVEKLVELFAIGIRTDAVKRYYKNCVQVNDISDLPKTCLVELDQLIRKGKSYR